MPRKKEPSQRDLLFVQWYTSPASPTFDNAMQSAIRAGFSESYAKSRAHQKLVPFAKKMVKERLARQTERAVEKSDFYGDLLRDAEMGIAERVRMNTKGDPKMTAIKQKDQHFVTERIGKDTWSQKKIVENGGLVAINADNLAKLVENLQSLMQEKPLHADYTVVKDPEKPTNRLESGDV